MIAFGDVFGRSRNPAFDGMLMEDVIAPQTWSVANASHNQVAPLKKQPTFINHRARANRAFVDGHIEPEDMRKTFAATDPQLRRWNYDNEPHRDVLRE